MQVMSRAPVAAAPRRGAAPAARPAPARDSARAHALQRCGLTIAAAGEPTWQLGGGGTLPAIGHLLRHHASSARCAHATEGPASRAVGTAGSCCAASRALRAHRALRRVQAAAADDNAGTPEPTAEAPPPPAEEPEEVFYEGSGGSNIELAASLALTATLVFAPLTMASIGRRLWVNYRFTNKRVVVQNTSPLFKGELQLTYDQIKEVRTAPRGFGAWGDMVIFTKRGERLELLGMADFQKLKDYMERQMYRVR